MTRNARSGAPKQRSEVEPIEDLGVHYEQLVEDGGRRVAEIIDDVLGADLPKPDEAACRDIYVRCFSAKNKFENHAEFRAAYQRVTEAANALADALREFGKLPESRLLFDIEMQLDRMREIGGFPGQHFIPRKPNSRSVFHPLVRYFARVVEAALRDAGHTKRLSPEKAGSFTVDITDRILEIFDLRPEGASADAPGYTASAFRDRPRKSDDVPFEVRFSISPPQKL